MYKKYLIPLLIGLFLANSVYAAPIPISWIGDLTSQILVPLNNYISAHVGIGTSTPAGLFSIHAPSNMRLATGSPILLIASSSLTSTTTFVNMSNTGSTTFWGILNIGSHDKDNNLATSTFNNGIRLTSGCFLLPNGTCAGSGGGSGTINPGTATNLAYYSGATTLDSANFLNLDISNSFLGIGTTTPGSRLSVAGNTYLDSNLITISSSSAANLTVSYQSAATTTIPSAINVWTIATSTSGTAPILSLNSVSGSLGVGIGTSTFGTLPFAVTTNPTGNSAYFAGNVGIGITNPQGNLVVADTRANADAYMLFQTDDTGVTVGDGLYVGMDTAAVANFWNYENTNAVFATNNAIRMTITSGGNIGIATATPGSILSIQGVANFTNDSTSTIYTALNFPVINATSTTATSTFGNGIQLANGCFRMPNGNCAISGGAGGTFNTGTANRLTYYSAANTLDSANFLTVDATNIFLGIGTTTPGSLLSVQGVVNFVPDSTSTIYTGLKIPFFHATSTTASSTIASGLIVQNGIKLGTPTGCNGNFVLETDADGDITCGADAGGGAGTPGGNTTELQYNNGGSFDGTLNTVWNNSLNYLGIGTTSPGSVLSVQGVGNFTANATSTMYSALSVPVLNATSTIATSTFGNGIQLANGCFKMPNGTCFVDSDTFILGTEDSTNLSADFYCGVLTSAQCNATEDNNADWISPVAFTATTLIARVDTAPGAGKQWDVYLRINGSNSTLTCTIANTDLTCSASGTIAIAAGDIVNFFFDTAPTPSGTAGESVSIVGSMNTGTGSISGMGGTNQITFWNSATNLGGSNNLIWDNGSILFGIGTSTPGTEFSVQGFGNFNSASSTMYSDLVLPYVRATSTVNSFLAGGTGSATKPSYTWSGDADTGIFSQGQNNLGFTTGTIERLRITNAGAISMGSSTPMAQYSFEQFATSSPVLIVGDNGTTSPLFIIDGKGFVGIATATPATSTAITGPLLVSGTSNLKNIFVQGTAFLPGLTQSASNQTYNACGVGTTFEMVWDTTTCLVSALKYKTNIHPLDAGLADLLGLEPVSYYKKEPLNESDSHKQMGFIADWVAKNPKLDEMLVTRDKNGDIRGFRYEQFTALITKSIQDFYKEFQSLVARVSGLEQKVNDQQKQIDELRNELNKLKK